jgi:CBS-domain-containing membrane protein
MQIEGAERSMASEAKSSTHASSDGRTWVPASKAPARVPLLQVARAFTGGALAIAVVGWLSEQLSAPLVLGSFGATCVLVFGFPASPFSQPRSVILGHVLATTTGVVFAELLGTQWWSMALALGAAIALMQLTRTVHPPAGSNPIIVMLSHASWPFILRPTLIGAVLVCVVALAYHRLTHRDASYPTYWF